MVTLDEILKVLGVDRSKLSEAEKRQFEDIDSVGLYHWFNLNHLFGVFVYALRGSDRYLSFSPMGVEHALHQIVEDVVSPTGENKHGTYLNRMKPYNNEKAKIRNALGMRNVGGQLKCTDVKKATPEWMIVKSSTSQAMLKRKVEENIKGETDYIFSWPYGLVEEEK